MAVAAPPVLGVRPSLDRMVPVPWARDRAAWGWRHYCGAEREEGGSVKEPIWQRVRRRKDGTEVDETSSSTEATAPRDPPRLTPLDLLEQRNERRRRREAAPDEEPDDELLERLEDLDETGEKRAEYAEWVERMRAKREEKVDRVRQLQDDADPVAGATYWSAESVFAETRRLEDDRPDVVLTRTELLATLGLSAAADDSAIVAAYRQLAKAHHPDRFPDADDETRAYHVDRMQRITAAYKVLRRGA
jgi:hypothetical protein